jgi:hypothetical protein
VRILGNRLNLHILTTKVLIIGAVIGLVFSNAEGVSLLPFPDSPRALLATANGDGEGVNEYNQSVRPDRSPQTKATKTKNADPLRATVAQGPTVEHNYSVQLDTTEIGVQVTHPESPAANSQVTRGPPAI